MQITFRGSPDLLKIDDIGEALVDANDSLRQQVIGLALAAIRDGGIPVRIKSGSKISPDNLGYAKRHARLVAKHKAEDRALKPSRVDLEIKLLRKERERYIESEGHMQPIARGIKLPIYDRNILRLAQNQEILGELEYYKQTSDEITELDKIYRKAFVRLSELAVWLRQERDIDVTLVAPSGAPEKAETLAKRRVTKTRAILKSFFDAGIGKNIESVWAHIGGHAGKENFPYTGVSRDKAVHRDGEEIKKDNMKRAIYSLLKASEKH